MERCGILSKVSSPRGWGPPAGLTAARRAAEGTGWGWQQAADCQEGRGCRWARGVGPRSCRRSARPGAAVGGGGREGRCPSPTLGLGGLDGGSASQRGDPSSLGTGCAPRFQDPGRQPPLGIGIRDEQQQYRRNEYSGNCTSDLSEEVRPEMPEQSRGGGFL